MADFATRLASAMQPLPSLDTFDLLAIDIITEAWSLPHKEARELIAARLRVLHATGVCEGGKQTANAVTRAFEKVGTA